ncbi:MAG: heavy-metal-associated domain-containing protein [Bacteroidetes bacterium]|nr:heavy-metal-associated domain-containing protein [Bacteroidota bacterium]
MRTLILSVFLLVSLNSFSQDNTIKTETLAVKGNCEECKKRIENAADIKGVKLAEWDENKQMLTVTYQSAKVTMEQIEQAVAKSGHDAGSKKASDAGYKKLPKCCQYRDAKCEDKK